MRNNILTVEELQEYPYLSEASSVLERMEERQGKEKFSYLKMYDLEIKINNLEILWLTGENKANELICEIQRELNQMKEEEKYLLECESNFKKYQEENELLFEAESFGDWCDDVEILLNESFYAKTILKEAREECKTERKI